MKTIRHIASGVLLFLILVASSPAAEAQTRSNYARANTTGQYQQYYQNYARPRQASSSRYQPETTASGKQKAMTFTDHVSVNGMTRSFIVHVPPGYDRNRALPVVLAFHGLHMSAKLMMLLTNLNGVADRNNFIVVYGDGVGGSWEDGIRSKGEVDDVQYVSALLTRLASIVNVDQRRIYACGISNGGYFTQVLACSMPERIAAAGVVASTLMEQATSRTSGSRSMPIAFILGTEDPLIAWGDGKNRGVGKIGELLGIGDLGSLDSHIARVGGVMSVPEVIQFWTNHNRTSSSCYSKWEPDRDPQDRTKVKRDTYGSMGGEVVLWTVEGGGHAWPGGFPYATRAIMGNISHDIDAGEVLWDFFKTHTR